MVMIRNLVYVPGLMLLWAAAVAGRDCICSMQWAPVCGTDGQTYGTACVANCRGVGVAYNGECSRGGGEPVGGGTGTSSGSWSNPRPTWPSYGPAPTQPPAGTWYNPGNPNYNNGNNNDPWSNPGRWGSSWWPRRLLYSSPVDAKGSAGAPVALVRQFDVKQEE